MYLSSTGPAIFHFSGLFTIIHCGYTNRCVLSFMFIYISSLPFILHDVIPKIRFTIVVDQSKIMLLSYQLVVLITLVSVDNIITVTIYLVP